MLGVDFIFIFLIMHDYLTHKKEINDIIICSSGYIQSLSLAVGFLKQEVTHGSGESLDDESCNFISSYVGALCHLLKKPGKLYSISIFSAMSLLAVSYVCGLGAVQTNKMHLHLVQKKNSCELCNLNLDRLLYIFYVLFQVEIKASQKIVPWLIHLCSIF